MKEEKEKIVLDTDPDAATLQTVTGWVSRNMKFYGKDEKMARFDGCTHKKCECGNIMLKFWTKCPDCRAKLRMERYNTLPFQEWDEKTPVCVYMDDEYFFNASELEDYCEDNELLPENLPLVLCKPIYARQIETDYWEDAIPENGDGNIPKELQKRLNELNNFISSMAPLSWEPSNIRTEYKSKQCKE
jgi:hypothetical protein